jgi:acetyltransferase-like isoleucine patch superfamily enzyme
MSSTPAPAGESDPGPLVGAAPPSGPPPSGVRARLRVRLAVWRSRGRITAQPGATAGPGVVWDLGRSALVRLGAGCALGAGTRVHVRDGELVVVAGAILGERCVLQVGSAVTIGARARLADEVVLADHGTCTEDPETPIRQQGVDAVPIDVGDGVLIGPRTFVGGGVRVGTGAQVSAGLTVVADVPAGARVDGMSASPPAVIGATDG